VRRYRLNKPIPIWLLIHIGYAVVFADVFEHGDYQAGLKIKIVLNVVAAESEEELSEMNSQGSHVATQKDERDSARFDRRRQGAWSAWRLTDELQGRWIVHPLKREITLAQRPLQAVLGAAREVVFTLET
jgi:hypothetical protein